jgi:ribose transport system permease protein
MSNLQEKLKKGFANGLAVWIIIFVLAVTASLISKDFATLNNVQNYLGQVPFLVAGTCGMLIALITGQIDLSVAALAKLTAVLVSGIGDGDPNRFGMAVLLCYAIGISVGLFNAFLIVRLNVPAFVATLGTFSILEGLVLAYTVKGIGSVPGKIISVFYDGIGPFPYAFIAVLVVLLLLGSWLKRSRLAMRMYAVGGDAEVARRSGVESGPVITYAMVLCSIFAVTAGVIQVGRAGVGAPTTANGLELAAITASVLGGISLAGGRGRLTGAVGGAVLITLIDNALNMIGVSQYTQGLFRGGVIVAAIAIFVSKKRESA